MNRLLLSALLVGLIAACSSVPQEQDPSAVEDRNIGEAVDRPGIKPAESQPLTDKSLAGDALTNPDNILSKRSVYYDFDSNLIKDEYKPVVAAHARYLRQHNDTAMRIEGNADERGSREYNLALGQRRANAVKQMMQLLGAHTDQIETVSYGEEKPRATGEDEASWAENRRSDIVYRGE